MEQDKREEPSLRELGDQMRDDLKHLRETARRRGDETVNELREWVGEHPLGAVAMAFGAGYALSGALLSRTTMRLAAMAARFYLARLVREPFGAEVMAARTRPPAGST